jgi:hypothetical protein
VHVVATAVAMGGFAVFTLAVALSDRSTARRILSALYVVVLTATVATVLGMIIVGRSPHFIGLAEWVILFLALACCVDASD